MAKKPKDELSDEKVDRARDSILGSVHARSEL